MNYSKFEPLLGTWGPSLQPFIENDACDIMYTKLKEERQRGKIFCPETHNIYRTFLETPKDDLKVVFVLMDPYPWIKRFKGVDTIIADGIAMSCSITGELQPSLSLFYEGIEDDLYPKEKGKREKFPDLKYLCNQGVMMLNTALTVEAKKTGSHTRIWRPFMEYLFDSVFTKMNNGLVFVLCGKQSQEMKRWINPLQHHILEREHPAAAAHKNRKWLHNGVFSAVNYILKTDKSFSPQWMYEKPPF